MCPKDSGGVCPELAALSQQMGAIKADTETIKQALAEGARHFERDTGTFAAVDERLDAVEAGVKRNDERWGLAGKLCAGIITALVALGGLVISIWQALKS